MSPRKAGRVCWIALLCADYGFYAGGYSFLCVCGGLIVCGILLDVFGVRIVGSVFVGLMAAGAGMYLVALGAAVVLIGVQCLFHVRCKFFRTKKYFQIKICFVSDGEENGTIIIDFTDEELAAFAQKCADEIWPQLVDLYGQDAVDLVAELRGS